MLKYICVSEDECSKAKRSSDIRKQCSVTYFSNHPRLIQTLMMYYWNLPVVDSEGRYVGFVSRSRLFTAYRRWLKETSDD